MIFYNNNFGFHLDFCGIPLVFNMDLNRFMIIGIKEKRIPNINKTVGISINSIFVYTNIGMFFSNQILGIVSM